MSEIESTSEETTCIVCGSTDNAKFIKIPHVPIQCNVLCPTRDIATQIPRGDISLGFCKKCCHIFNTAFRPEKMKYDQDYETSLHFSSRFQEYARGLAKRLIYQYDLHKKEIIEIGCGKGDFLNLLCSMGGNHGIGFDQSYDPNRTDNAKNKNITFIQDFYSSHYACYNVDFICCRHVLEHIQSPTEFISNIREAIEDRHGINIFFEVPNVEFTLKDLGIWDLIYEHCSYFCKNSLTLLFSSCGFDVWNCIEAFEGQFLNLDAILTSASKEVKTKSQNDNEEMANHVETFSHKYNRIINQWKDRLHEFSANGKCVVLWGAGSKGVTFLNVTPNNLIEYVIDINPNKQGMYIPGTGQKIVSPEFLSTYKPDAIIVMNPIYRHEIEKMVHDSYISPEFILA